MGYSLDHIHGLPSFSFPASLPSSLLLEKKRVGSSSCGESGAQSRRHDIQRTVSLVLARGTDYPLYVVYIPKVFPSLKGGRGGRAIYVLGIDRLVVLVYLPHEG